MNQTENEKYRRRKGPVLDPAKVDAIITREGRTINWIADKCFLSRDSMRQILRGRRAIGGGTFQLLIQALGCEPHELAANDEAEAS